MSKEMLINNVEGHECRIAIVENGVLEELYVERASSQSHVGNVYKGRILNVEASIQAAFVDFGLPKNGFLHISDVHPEFFPRSKGQAASEPVGHKTAHRDRPPIQECLRRGQEVIVQVTKEGIGTKGPTLTTYISIPGRMLVIMPGMSRLGISRKIETEEGRAQARTAMSELTFPPEHGFILRTAGLGRSKRDLQRDLNYLVRLWKTVSEQIKAKPTPCEIYRESDLVIRTIRDIYGSDIDRVICDDPAVAKKVTDFISVAMPRSKHRVELYTGRDGLFQDTGLEDEIEKIYARKVDLPGGGYLVIDQTEALVAIDVNSGRYREHSDAETSATKLNLTAAKEVARQLRLRDLGGMVAIDFIDMREGRNCRAVEKMLKTAMTPDRAKSKILRMSAFGIVELTRQRLGPSLRHSVYSVCSHCEGMGLIKSPESQALQAMRMLRRAAANEDVTRVELTATLPVEHELANRHRAAVAALEAKTGKRILLTANDDLKGEEIRVTCLSTRGTEVAWEAPESAPTRGPLATIGMDQVPPPEDELADEEAVEEAQQPAATPQMSYEADQYEEPEESEEAPESEEPEEAGGRQEVPEAAPPQQPQRSQQRPRRDRQGRPPRQPQQQQPRQQQQPKAQRPPGQQQQQQQQRQSGQQQPQRQPSGQQQQPQRQPSRPPQGQPGQQQPQAGPPQDQAGGIPGTGKKSRRRGRRGGRKHRKKGNGPEGQPQGGQPQAGQPAQTSGSQAPPAQPQAQVQQHQQPTQPPPAPAPEPAKPVEQAPAPRPAPAPEPAPAQESFEVAIVDVQGLEAAPVSAPAAPAKPAAKAAKPAPRPKARRRRPTRGRAAKKATAIDDPNAIPEDTLSDDAFVDEAPTDPPMPD